ncbi:ribonuclease HII [uncultured Psychroserpens sp.]|uniref:ribonuclease HII n=1 Tax=uncultured Psychroserpens sp. TaxID=255436 RepID=UPI00260BE8A6|nr:ribonuclease HII [uncultured Psychroserpens sp.]
MKKVWFIFFCCTILYNCKNSKSKSTSLLSLVPENSQIIIKINSSEGLENGLKNNTLIQAVKSYTSIKNFDAQLIPIYNVDNTNSLIALSKDKNDSLEISFIAPLSKNGITLDSIPNLQIDSTFYDTSSKVRQLNFNGKRFYSTIIDSVLFVSNVLETTKNAKPKKQVNAELETIFKTSDSKKMVSIFFNHQTDQLQPTIFNNAVTNDLQFSNYTLIDSDISQNEILLNGITKASDSTESLINIFRNTIPQENQIARILPVNISGFSSITFDNYDVFKENLIAHKFQDSIQDYADVYQNIVEIGSVHHDNETSAIILRSIDAISTLDNLNSTVTTETYRGINLFQLNSSDMFLNYVSPLIKTPQSITHYINIDDFFIFSDQVDVLKSIISAYQNNLVLSESSSYKNLKLNLSDEASLLIFGDSSELNNILNANFTDDKNLDISRFKTSAIQYVYDINFAHVNAVFKTQKRKASYNSVSEEFNISIDSDLISKPQLLKNHTNNQMDIVVQDVQNNLYLISNTGKVFWKKQLEGPILGDVNQIDTYKNGRLQLVFNTAKRLYVLDRNGKDVGAFPLKFNDNITQPVSVFDYDKRKNYRLMITQGKSVLMYDKKGKIVEGFKYKSSENTITSQPKHFRIGSKDYIVFAHGNKIEILDRVGKKRITAKENISFSDNEIYLYNNKFTTSNTNGELIEINQSGHVSHKNLNANTDHKISTTSKTLVVLNDNKLTIKSKTIELDFGDYTAPKIFYINNKIYVTLTDLQSKRGYLFDSQAKPIGNFPVYANSQLELNNIDRDNALEVITKGDNDAIIVYEF